MDNIQGEKNTKRNARKKMKSLLVEVLEGLLSILDPLVLVDINLV